MLLPPTVSEFLHKEPTAPILRLHGKVSRPNCKVRRSINERSSETLKNNSLPIQTRSWVFEITETGTCRFGNGGGYRDSGLSMIITAPKRFYNMMVRVRIYKFLWDLYGTVLRAMILRFLGCMCLGFGAPETVTVLYLRGLRFKT